MRRDCGNCVYARVCRQHSCPAAQPTPWFETPEEIEAGLAWGERKTFLMRWVRRHMGDALSRGQQKVVELHLFKGMTFGQIAKVTGVDRGDVCRSMKRSVVRLHRLWRAKEPARGKHAKRRGSRGGKSPGMP